MAATATVRDVSKGRRASALNQMIDQAGNINAEQRHLKAAYDELRGQIEVLMPMGDLEEVSESGEEYRAVRSYPAERSIDPMALFKFDKELFWRAVKVPVGDIEKVLSAADFHKLITVKEADTPKLVIKKIKSK